MKTALLAASVVGCLSCAETNAQLLISEFQPNPPGTDSPQEWVELVAASHIDFSATPYSVVFANNTGSLSGTNGWATGFNVTYGFNITSGTVNPGDIVYVGGTGMSPTGTKLRVIDTGTTAGDGFGLPASGGVLGNGGTTADGVAVFNTAIGNVNASLTPVDAILYGTATAGIGAYALPANDHYNGGVVQDNSFLAPDPGGGDTIFATGAYNPQTGTWDIARTWQIGATSDRISTLSLVPVPEPSTAAVAALGALITAVCLRARKREKGVRQ